MAVATKKALKAKADRLAGDLVRARGYCEAIGKDHVHCSSGALQWAHIITRGNLRLRWEPMNALCLCAGHHFYYTNHPEQWFLDFVPKHFPEQFEFVQQHRNELFDGDYERIINGLKEQTKE